MVSPVVVARGPIRVMAYQYSSDTPTTSSQTVGRGTHVHGPCCAANLRTASCMAPVMLRAAA